MRWPMLPLALGVAIFDRHTRLTYLETDDAPLLAALGAAAGSRNYMIIHFESPNLTTRLLIIDCFFGGSRLR